MPSDTSADTGGTPLLSNDQGQLHIQIDACATDLPSLMAKTRAQINDALADGDVATAQQLGDTLTTLTNQYAVCNAYQIAVNDQSQEMHDAILAMAKVNRDIATALADTASVASFLGKVSAVATGLNTVVGKVITKKTGT